MLTTNQSISLTDYRLANLATRDGCWVGACDFSPLHRIQAGFEAYQAPRTLIKRPERQAL
jgi:hypothetical protein